MRIWICMSFLFHASVIRTLQSSWTWQWCHSSASGLGLKARAFRIWCPICHMYDQLWDQLELGSRWLCDPVRYWLHLLCWLCEAYLGKLAHLSKARLARLWCLVLFSQKGYALIASRAWLLPMTASRFGLLALLAGREFSSPVEASLPPKN